LKIKEVFASSIEVAFAGKDIYQIVEPVTIKVKTFDSGTLGLYIAAGFITDMRSGCHAIDPIIPKFTKNNIYNAAILMHDCNYTQDDTGEHFLSKETSDLLLRDMVKFSGEVGSIRAALMYSAVAMFGNSAYYDPPTGVWAKNGKYIKFKWVDK